jgi:hypothetical protein
VRATGAIRSSPGVPVESAGRSGKLLFNPRANELLRDLEQFGYGGTDEPRHALAICCPRKVTKPDTPVESGRPIHRLTRAC